MQRERLDSPLGVITLRPAAEADTPAIASFLGSVQPDNPKRDPAVLRWQYWENPDGPATSWVAVTEDARIVGHHMNLSLRVLVDGQVRPMGKSGDMAVAPAVRGCGVAAGLARATYATMASRGHAHSLVSPNGQSRTAISRGGRVPSLRRLPFRILPIDAGWAVSQLPVPAAAHVALRGLLPRLRRRVTVAGDVREGVPPDIDELWATAVSDGSGCRVVHDGRWWGWRFRRPGGQYEVAHLRRGGQAVACVASMVRDTYGGPVLHVLDVLTVRPHDGASLVGHLIDRHDGDVVAAAGVGFRGTTVGDSLTRAGLRWVPPQLHPTPTYLGFSRNAPDAEDLTDRRWTLTWADLDHL